MPKNAKPVTLPAAAVDHMAPQAKTALLDHFVFDNVVNNSAPASPPADHLPEQAHVPPVVPPPVTLPDAASLPAAAVTHMAPQAKDNLADHFVFDTNIVNNSGPPSQPIDHLPEQAVDHVPPVVPPPVTLPEAALGHMPDVAKEQLAAHTDWFI